MATSQIDMVATSPETPLPEELPITIDKAYLKHALQQPANPMPVLDALVASQRVHKHTVLEALAEHFGVAAVEYDEMIVIPAAVATHLDLEQLKKQCWFPVEIRGTQATIAASNPRDPALGDAVETALGLADLRFVVSLPSDIRRFIENHQDVNPHFPASAGRTILARLRNWLAEQRTLLAQYRTNLAKGRTGLAFMRTGLAFISIAFVLFRLFGLGYLALLDLVLLGAGAFMAFDGLRWYVPARRAPRIENISSDSALETTILAVDGLKWSRARGNSSSLRNSRRYNPTEPTFGTTVLEWETDPDKQEYRRTEPIEGAEELRLQWNRLTPVMRRRFLAIDRTDLAEERTFLAHYRTVMACARTALAFTRTGIAFSGLGVALLRQFPASAWTVFDFTLILLGIGMTLEGFRWYIPGRTTTKKSAEAVMAAAKKMSIWDFIFRPFHKRLHLDDLPPTLAIKGTYAPGIWGTTGLALERTLIAERRNVKSRLRTIMARSRTGMSFIRTGNSLFSVGMGLQVYFGAGSLLWTMHNLALMLVGGFLVADGFYWHLPAEKTRKEFPYCGADMEIMFADYARPQSLWKKVVVSHDDR